MKSIINLITTGKGQLFERVRAASSTSPLLNPSSSQNYHDLPSFFHPTSRRLRFSMSSIASESKIDSSLSILFEQRKTILFHQTWLQIQYCFRMGDTRSRPKELLTRVKNLDILSKNVRKSQSQEDFIEAFENYKPSFQQKCSLHSQYVDMFDSILEHFIFGKRRSDIFRPIIADYQSMNYGDVISKTDADFNQIKSMLTAIIQEFSENTIWTDTSPRSKFCRAITEAESEADIAIALYYVPSSYYFPDWTQFRYRLLNGVDLYQINKMKFFLEILAGGEPAIRAANQEIIAEHYSDSWGEQWKPGYDYDDRMIFPYVLYGKSNRVIYSIEDTTLEHRKTAIFMALKQAAKKMLQYKDERDYLKLIQYFHATYKADNEQDLQTIHSQLIALDNFYISHKVIDFYIWGKSDFYSIPDIIECERLVENSDNASISNLFSEMQNTFILIKFNLIFLFDTKINHVDWKKLEPTIPDDLLNQLKDTKDENELVAKLKLFNLLNITWEQARPLLAKGYLQEFTERTPYEDAIKNNLNNQLIICRILQIVPDFIISDFIKDTLTIRYGFKIAIDIAHDDERCSQSRYWYDEIGSSYPDHQLVRTYVVEKCNEWVLNGTYIDEVQSHIQAFQKYKATINDDTVKKEWKKHAPNWIMQKMNEYNEKYPDVIDSSCDESNSSRCVM